MKQHLFTLIAVLVSAILFSPLLSFSQDWQGGSTTNTQVPEVKSTTTGPSEKDGTLHRENLNTSAPRENITPVAPRRGNETDEFAYFGQNAAGTGFGANASTRGTVSNSGNYYGGENFDGSMECWVFFTSLPSTGTTLLSLGSTSNKSFGWYVTSAGQFTFRIGTTELVHTGTALTLNTWTHVAVTWTGGGPYTVTFYVNGAQSGSTMNHTGTWNTGTSSDSLRIGRDQSFTSSALNGSIDEVRFWGDQRTLAEVRDNRFIGFGDLPGINTSNAITSSSHYDQLSSSWGFNIGNNPLPDPIGGTARQMTLVGGVAAAYVQQGISVPYNFALKLPGGATTNRVNVPHNAGFNLTTQGTMDCWANFSTAATHFLFGKGATAAGSTWIWGMSASGGLFFWSSGSQVFSTGPNPTLNQWHHVAVTWNDVGATYEIKFYLDGQQHGTTLSLPVATFATNTDPLTIGDAQGSSAPMIGYMDEARIWNLALNIDQIKYFMSCSVKSGTGILATNCIGAWNFDGNLLDYGTLSGIDGTFSTGGTNDCKLSGFLNETTSGAPGITFDAHATTVNRNTTPNPFPGGFALRQPNKPIPDVTITRDTITFPSGGALTSVELFVHLQHTFAADLDIVLRAPNGTTRDISSDNGSSNEGGYLTIFVDGALPVTTATFYPPYSNVAGPEVAMGNMGGTSIAGNWILEITDDAGGDVGKILGWGLRINGSVTGIEPITGNVPNKFNLYQNYPNPFNPMTNIKFDLAKDVNVKIAIYDIVGREVKTLVNQFTKAGTYEIPFDGTNLASGTYFYRLEAGDFVDVKKMVIVK